MTAGRLERRHFVPADGACGAHKNRSTAYHLLEGEGLMEIVGKSRRDHVAMSHDKPV